LIYGIGIDTQKPNLNSIELIFASKSHIDFSGTIGELFFVVYWPAALLLF
jgi:hypothetical protein